MSQTKEKAKEEINKYINEIHNIYNKLLLFVDNQDSIAEDDFQHLILDNSQYDIQGNKERFNHFIGLLISISNDHYRRTFFFEKIERILITYSDTIKANNTNIDIFNQFSSNKRLLYFLVKEKILTIDS